MSLRLTAASIKNYRSIRSLRFPAGRLTVFVGKNAVGKTNLYNALKLLREAAQGAITHAIVAEGGMRSVLWAGRHSKGPLRLVLSAEFEEFEYKVEVGLPALGAGRS